MERQNSEGEEVDISLITQAAVGYVKGHVDSQRAAEKFVSEVRVYLGQIIETMDSAKQSPLGNRATPESIALLEYVDKKMKQLESEKGYAHAQASAIVLKDDLVPLQVVAGMANDTEMSSSVRKVNAHLISELGNIEPVIIDPRSAMKRKKRGRAPGSGKKKSDNA